MVFRLYSVSVPLLPKKSSYHSTVKPRKEVLPSAGSGEMGGKQSIGAPPAALNKSSLLRFEAKFKIFYSILVRTALTQHL